MVGARVVGSTWAFITVRPIVTIATFGNQFQLFANGRATQNAAILDRIRAGVFQNGGLFVANRTIRFLMTRYAFSLEAFNNFVITSMQDWFKKVVYDVNDPAYGEDVRFNDSQVIYKNLLPVNVKH